MDYYGLLFLYYLKGLSGKSILRLFFNIEVGGTEQLLPENTSTPTTTPILADIQYPDGLRTDQYFTYRETPTTVSNKARIKTIKGNTLVWNQLLREISSAYYASNNSSTHYSDGNVTLTATTTSYIGLYIKSGYRLTKAGHKYLYTAKVTSSRSGNIYIGTSANGETISVSTSPTTIYSIKTATVDDSPSTVRKMPDVEVGDTLLIENFMCFDLTQMGLDITNPSDFTSLFSLPYYDFNQGSLLSFMGNGIKTVGKNQCNADDVQVGKAWNNTSNSARAVLFAPIRPNAQYTISITSLGTVEGVFIVEESEIGIGSGISATLDNSTKSFTFTSRSNSKYIALQCNKTAITKSDFESVKFMLERGATASSFEPYTSSTLSLPISTYFSNGMKSAGNVYDELTETKAITRIGMVDLGTLTWYYDSTNNIFNTAISDMVTITSQNVDSPLLCSIYATGNSGYYSASRDDKTIWSYVGSARIVIKDTSYNTPESFKSAMSGVFLYYELATPTETPITTEDANEALSLLMGKSVSSSNANQLIDIITKGE